MNGTLSQKIGDSPNVAPSLTDWQGERAWQEAGGGTRRKLVASITRLYPFYSGCGSVANCRLVRTLAGPAAGLDWVRLRHGQQLRVMLGDYLSNTVYFSRDWDPKISWTCEQLLRCGDTALDIGANLGVVTCQMAALVGATGRVHAFEPNPVVAGLLAQSLHRNGYSQVTLHPFALGDVPGELELTVPPRNQCLATLARTEDGTRIRVPVKTLSQWFQSDRPSHIRLMKIDVEGFEDQVFRGADQLFDAVRPDAILFELNKYDGPFESHPTVQFLRRHNYDFLMLPKKLLRPAARRFESQSLTGSPSNDLIAAPRGAIYGEVARRLKA